MKHLVVGTAGHIDHGKTELVKALTGINPDRLKEERERGITIDIGFAPLALGPGFTAGFVDVPGHERFIKNMLAGVWGIDLVMLVIAADESIMPQTREHFAICSLLRVPRGLIALTKCDLVDDDLRDLAAMEARDFVRGSFLEGAPVIPVSARTGIGLEDLKAELGRLAGEGRPGRGGGLLRLPVDRSFSIRGFGTVVTGTLVSGTLREGDDVAIYPGGAAARVRGIQVHGQPAPEAGAGQRTAVNLQGLDADAVARGDVLGRPREMAPSSLLDVTLAILPGAPGALRDLARVRFHQGTSELMARVKLLDRRELAPGEQGPAQIRLERPGCSLPGDRFVIRRYSPPVTIGGGMVLDTAPLKHRGAPRPDLISRLDRLKRATPEESLMIYLEERPAGIRLDALALRAGRTVREAADLLDGRVRGDLILRAGEGSAAVLLAPAAARGLEESVTEALNAYHRAHPLKPGMPREELRERALGGSPPEVCRLILERLSSRGAIVERREATVRLASHQVTLSGEDERVMRLLSEAFEQEDLNPPELQDLVRSRQWDPDRADRIVGLMLIEGRLIRLGDGRLFSSAAIDRLKRKLWDLRDQRPLIDIGSFKEMTGTSRKNAIPLLEHLDAVKVTRRHGSDREILPPPVG